jgi:SAM-dependent methyltransferase
VTTYPSGFLPDLRRLRRWPGLRDSLWRNPDLVRLTYTYLARLVRSLVGSPPCSVLYVGPGLGHIALELARAGHAVQGVDVDPDSVALATRAAETDPLRDRRGPLSYGVAEFPDAPVRGPYDRVLFSRVLHHLEDPATAVARAAELLRPGGRVVCVEFAHDRLTPAGARWLARSRMWLSRKGWWPERVSGSVVEETKEVARDWRVDHEDEGLNPLGDMLAPLRMEFRIQRPAWHPYLFWDMAAEMRVPSDQEGTVARRMRDQEAGLLRQGHLRGVLFSTTGRARAASG